MTMKSGDRYWPFLCAAVLALSCFLYYQHNIKTLAPLAFPVIDAVFFADSADHVEFFKEGEAYVARDDQHATRHVLYWPVAGELFGLVSKASGREGDDAIILLLTLLATANVLLVYLVLLKREYTAWTALQFATLYGVMFANVIYFSIPETYVYSTAMISVYAMALTARASNPRVFMSAMILSAIVGVSGLFSATLMSLALPTACFLFMRCSPGRFVLYGLASALLAVFVFFAPRAFLEPDFFEIFRKGSDTVSEWASVSNFLWAGPYKSVVLSFLGFSVVAPVGSVANIMRIEDVWGYFEPSRFAIFVMYLIACLLAVRQLIRERDEVVSLMWLWVAALALFHVYFAPWDAFIYSVQVTVPATLLFHHAYRSSRFRYKHVFAWLAIGLLAVNNSRVIYSAGG